MTFDHHAFSRRLKLALADYQQGMVVELRSIADELTSLASINTNELVGDDLKKAFWINVYNGLTNYLIIDYQLKKSVWELPGFFSEMTVNVGGFLMSLDDMEHGVLRRNGARRNYKPRQFAEDDKRRALMVDNFDPRVHFALNCGSLSCPALAFYTAENMEEELTLAEAAFADQEFIADHQNHKISCSELFIWYRHDFVGRYLDAPAFEGYEIVPTPYQWVIPVV